MKALCIESILQQDLDGFKIRAGVDPKQIINEQDEKEDSLLHVLANNASLMSVEALNHLLKLCEKNNISKSAFLNRQNSQGLTALSVCVKSSASLNCRMMLIDALISQGANPLLGNSPALMKQFPASELRQIGADSTLKAAYMAICHKIFTYAQSNLPKPTPAAPPSTYTASFKYRDPAQPTKRPEPKPSEAKKPQTTVPIPQPFRISVT